MRDTCILMNGEDNCKTFIEDHNKCLILNGFKVPVWFLNI